MDYLDIGDTINYSKYNALVYLLRKFKRLTSDLRISTVINSDYGIYTFSNGLTSIGGNYILEDDVTITSDNCLKNCFYTFIFTAIDVNLTGEVNKREIAVTGGTGENGALNVTLESDVLASDEVLLPDFSVSIVFDPHEYYTPVDGINIEISCDKTSVDIGETCTITAVATNVEGEPYEDIDLDFRVNGVAYAETTDEDGVAEHTYTGVGGVGKVTVTVLGKSVWFYDGVGLLMVEYTGNSITLGYNHQQNIFSTTTDVLIDWGDDTTTLISKDNIPKTLSHTYTDGLNSHIILFNGNITGFKSNCFRNCTGLTSINIPNTVTSISDGCFWNCTGLTSITLPNSITFLNYSCFKECTNLTFVLIPDSVTTMQNSSFYGCSALVDYQLYWSDDDIITYASSKMPNNTNSVFTVPCGQKSNYIAKGYPTAKVQERPNSLTVTADKPILQSGETSTITCKLACGTGGISGKTLSYEIKHGSTTIDSGTDTTNSNGEITITYTGTAVGQVDVIVKYGTLLQEIFVVYDTLFYDSGLNDSSKNNNWSTSNLQITTDNTGTLVSNSTTNNVFYRIYKNSALVSFNTPYIFEFEVIEYTGTITIVNDGSSNIRKAFGTLSVQTGDTVRIEYDGETCKYYVNDVYKTGQDISVTSSNTSVGFRINPDSSLKYKILKVYPV